ncbi:Retrovirus-related Pol polyprotein from transposon RE1 [Bienertia sinuspersici]
MVDDAKIDPASPFYLGSGDQPGNLISHVILKGDNYLAWSRAITLSSKSRRKFGFVDGTISKPIEKKKLLDWETVNSMLVSWILRATELKLAASIPYFEEAKKLWDYLEKRFCEASGPRLQQLRAAITDCKQSKTMSVEEYYTTLMGLYDDLNRLKPPRGCECGQCECNLTALFQLDREEEHLHQFLIGIDDDKYAMVRTNLLSQQPPVTLDRAYQSLLQKERSRAVADTKTSPSDAHIFALPPDCRPSSSSPARVDKTKLFCSHCKRTGHDTSGCFLLHGYPDWWLEKFGKKRQGPLGSSPAAVGRVPQPAAAASSSARAHAILTPSATASSAAPLSATSMAAIGVKGSSIGGTNLPPTATLAALSELQPEHVRLLMNMVQQHQQDKMTGEPLSLSWIVDTGASHHVTDDATCLMDVHTIYPCPVGLPDGSHAMATTEGCVFLADNIILEHVLFVPQLNCNLISVSKMIDDSQCFVQFTDSLCAIQDRLSRSLIGAGERIDGLYYFQRLPKVCAVTNTGVSTFELWHRRMGHPSDNIVKLVPAICRRSTSQSLNKACIVCPQAKQSRDSFPNSDSRASRIFELIHCDLWGSYKTPSSCGAHYFLTIVDDFSRGVWVYLLKDKTEVYSSFRSFFAMVKCQFEVSVKYVRSDNGTEFKSMLPFFDTHGILFQTSCAGTPQQNGRVERKHQHILNVSRALRFQGNLPISF